MTPPPEDAAPDAELERLVSRFLDHTLTPEDSSRLDRRIREEPVARDYCARALRFDAALQEALDPKALEWEETRRVIFDPQSEGPMWSVQREQTLRYGDRGRPRVTAPVRNLRLLGACLAALLTIGAGGYFYLLSHPIRQAEPQSFTPVAAPATAQEHAYTLRNGDFEAMDLSQTPSGFGLSVLHWQDNFTTEGAKLCEIGKVSDGKIFAKSGRNVVWLKDQAFLNQLILDQRGEPLKAAPGLRVCLSGWAYVVNGVRFPSLRGSLRFVASGYPDMIQYEAAALMTPLQGGGWKPFRIDLEVPLNLLRPASDVASGLKPPPSINLEGKELTISVDSRNPAGELLLDDLKIEVTPPSRP